MSDCAKLVRVLRIVEECGACGSARLHWDEDIGIVVCDNCGALLDDDDAETA